MSSFEGASSTELQFPVLHLLSHSLSAIFLARPFEPANRVFEFVNTSHSGVLSSLIPHGAGWVIRRTGSCSWLWRWMWRWSMSGAGWVTGYLISVAVLGLLIYDAFRPRPLAGIPTSGNLCWALGDGGALYRHMARHKTRTSFFVAQAQRVGPLSQVLIGPAGSWFGKLTGLGSYIVVLADGTQLVEVCARRTREFPDPGLTLDIYHGIIPNGQLALPTGQTFKHHRRAIAQSMSSSHLSKITPKITTSVIELIELWKQRSQILDESGELYFKAAQDLRLSTMDTISDIIFGKPFGVMRTRIEHLEAAAKGGVKSADARPQFPALARALNVIVAEVARCYVAPSKKLFWLVQRVWNAEWRRAKASVFGFLEAAVVQERARLADERHYRPGECPDRDAESADSVLSLLVRDEETAQARGEKPLSMDEITQELLVYWVAGHGTMACTLAWAVKLLSNHPRVQQRLHAELAGVLPSLNERPTTYADMSRHAGALGYLDATCHEILRCARTLGEVSRTSRTETTVMGHVIPKDTVVMMPHSYLGAGEGASPSDFCPERWLDVDGRFDAHRPGPLHVFGHGPRGCFGKNLAMLELKLYIALLSMEIFFDKVPEEVNTMESIELVANHPRNCVVRPRPWSELEKAHLS